MPLVPVAQLQDYVGKELGRSEWLTIDQQRINQFAECTGDHQFIHVDPVKAKHTPFGSTIAHGFLTRSLLPRLTEGRGHIVNITSIAGREAYPNGAGYTAAKHAARVVTETLRIELNGTPVRVTDIAPGLVETEFSEVRFNGDKDRAKKVYDGITPLVADDIAECVVWAVDRPWHVNIDEIVLKPLAQASATRVARGVGL